jgi:nanoRNase/pAp phosphatase (c-di-AMP/oligoRNAs hydrolase)
MPKKRRRAVTRTSRPRPRHGHARRPRVAKGPGADPGFDLDGALARLRGRKRALILTHDNPDPDSIAAAEGLRVLLERELGLSGSLAFGGIIGRAENRAMVSVLDIHLTPIEQIDLAAHDTIALVDTQPRSGNNSLPAGATCDVVIDHHPRREGSGEAAWYDVRSSLGASSTIVYGYLRAYRVPLDARLATAFLYALKSETRDLGREATDAERAAYVDLVALADHATMYRIVSPKLPREHFVALDRALRSAHLHGDLLAVNLGALDYPDLVAEVADLMLPYEAARWVVCAGYHGGAVYLSIRTEVEGARAGELIRRVVGNRGAAGGHGLIAGGRLYARVSSEEALVPVYRQIVETLCAELQRPFEPAIPLLRPA